MVLVIMAAGMGSRFGGAKQVEPVDDNGCFLVDYSIFDSILSGFSRVILIVSRENIEIIKSSLGKRIEKFVKVEFVIQDIEDDLKQKFPALKLRQKPLGTGHAVLIAEKIIANEPFCVINADDFYGRNAFATISKFFEENHDENSLALVTYKALDTLSGFGEVKRGVCKINGEFLSEIEECKIFKQGENIIAESLTTHKISSEKLETAVSMNMFGLRPCFFKLLNQEFLKFLNNPGANLETDEFFLPSVINFAIKNKIFKVFALESKSKWMGLTFREDLENVKAQLKALTEMEIYPKKLWK